MKNIENKFSRGMFRKSTLFFPFLLIALAFLPMRKARAQGPPPVEELRGCVNLNSYVNVDSVVAFNKRNNNLLASSSIMPIDTGGTVTVPGYRFVIEGQAGVIPGDTLYFKARDISDTDYGLRPEDGSIVTYKPGQIKRIDMKVFSSDVKSEDNLNLLRNFTLYQNYPNPFNSSTTIGYDLPRRGIVSLTVYDVLGRNVQSLVEELEQKAGEHEISFDAKGLASGVYFYRLDVSGRDGKNSSSGKMSFVK